MAAGGGLRAAVRDVAQRASAVARLQAELFKTELAETSKNAGIGVGLALAAAFIGVFAFGLLTTLFVVALANVLPLWLAILIVLVVYLGLAALLLLLARSHFAQAKGAPQAAAQAQLTMEALGFSQGENGDSQTSPPVSQPPSASVTGVTAAAPPTVSPTTDRRPDGR